MSKLDVDEALVDAIAQESYDESSNLATSYTPWVDLDDRNRDRIREVVRDVLNTQALADWVEAVVAHAASGDPASDG